MVETAGSPRPQDDSADSPAHQVASMYGLTPKVEAAILEADGRLEASKRDAKAKVVLAEASKEAIERITGAIQGQELPVMYLLGERYVDSMRDMATSDNAKTIVIPADLPAAVRGILNNPGK